MHSIFIFSFFSDDCGALGAECTAISLILRICKSRMTTFTFIRLAGSFIQITSQSEGEYSLMNLAVKAADRNICGAELKLNQLAK